MIDRILRTRQLRFATTLLLCMAISLGAETPAEKEARDAQPASVTAPAAQSSEIEQLKAMLLEQQRQISEQQRQIDELRRDLAGQRPVAPGAEGPNAPVGGSHNLGEVASTTPIIPVGSVASTPVAAAALPAQSMAPAPDAVQKAINSINANLRGFRLSGDMRFRTDLLVRDANPEFSDNRSAPAQRARERYRFRFNLDKDLFFKEGDDRPLATFHAQLATDPFNNPITMDTDFAGISTRAPISIAEAYMEFRPTKSLSLRIGRTPELYADNRQFVYDDDIRFNGFHETYRVNGSSNGAFLQIAAAQYILTDPNIQVVPTGSPFLAAGYAVGQRIPSSNLFDQGVTVGSNIGKKWTHNETINYFSVREPNQIQLASTTGGAALFANNPVLGATLIGNLGGTGNATTTAGGATYFASNFHVVRGAFNLNYSGTTIHNHNFPFQLFLQGTHNSGASFAQNAFMAGASWGQTARMGDFQLQYQYFYKPANAFIAQFSDDDVGTGSGVNVRTNQIRVNFGLTRFLAWENRLYIQKGIETSNPSINFFVPFQRGYNTQYRLHSQFVFTF